MLISRDKYLNDLIVRMGNGMVKVVTGARRCGKTFLLFELFEKHLRAQGVDDDHIIEIALDDLMYARYRDPLSLYDYVKSRIVNRSEPYYVLLDEVQYAISDKELRSDEPPQLYGVLNGLLRMRNVDVYVTGSNSKMLSTDVMTQFRGRGDEIRVRPLSFAEFMQAYEGDVQHGWAEYVMFGGMPLTLSMKTDEQKSLYLKNLFAETYLKDIVARNGLRRSQELDDLVDVLASSIGALTNPPKIKATFDSMLHSRISANTIMQYIEYLEEAFVIEEARRFDVKGRKYIGSPKKYYFEDMGLRNARLGFRQIEQTHIMENIVYNELRMRGFNVDVGVVEQRGTNEGKPYRKQLEVDFVANLGNWRYYIQSAYQLPTPEKVAQEKASLLRIDDSFQKIILVRDVVKPVRDEHGILTMSVYDFLLDPDGLAA
ncbi:ATP-binding protein [Bifidobacterium vespertilionis]|uniref:ATP-binding protein n=1 Tax=Bifidobacterium vespertilionis TaxID=2562524 RepID=A0A5J5E3K5_9BIFI|nr:ATP-binding protein [Bifidobacterium vespertilionis]KAA8821144.1 ATP-binding protein [Bifidobacterium vespertilionis]KAA8823625.1 ATP-binding protein [Bifidobacterium vespertilionis]MBT1178856.1 ATP-binding protein [Bifidobacterium vespertilionis]